LPVVTVCSLAALALQGTGEAVFVASDARMREVYSAAYEIRAGQVLEVQAPRCTPPRGLELPPEGAWFAIGSALETYATDFPPAVLARLCGRNAAAVPRAAQVATIARHELQAGRGVAPERATPLYVRDKVALTTAERLAHGGRV
jgi:tRNA threonylcarbamoyladenosine biosynthesis protein TsaB